jgi:membrane protease YdiL (CAAX protease family)
MKPKAFSLKVYLAVVLLLSWPFQFIYVFLGQAFRPVLLISMVMSGVAAYVCGRFIFKDGFKSVGWSMGKLRHYLFAFGLPLLLWLAPVFLEHILGLHVVDDWSLGNILKTFITSFCLTLIPAFGEEFNWRGYLLPRLLERYSSRQALLLHGFITWFWHLPVVVVMGLSLKGNPLVTVPTVALISLIPTIMHAIVFAYVWSISKSIFASTVYHSVFDEVRDSLQNLIGFGPIVVIWQMVLLTLLGLTILIRNRLLVGEFGIGKHLKKQQTLAE